MEKIIWKSDYKSAYYRKKPNPMPAMNPFSVFRRVGKDDLLSLEKPWCALEKKMGGPIEQFGWAAASAEFTNASQIEIIGVMRGDELSAVAPLTVKRVAGVERRMMLGVDEYWEPMGFLSANAESLDCLARALATDLKPMLLARLPSETGGVEALRSAFKNRSLMIERPSASFPFIPLDESWCEPERHFNPGRRSDLRRMQRRLKSLGHATTEILAVKPEQLDSLLDEAFQVEARSWKGVAGTALVYDKKTQAHLRKYLHYSAREGILRIGFLRVDGKAIAMKIAIEKNNALWLLKIGYDATFAHCSPGQLLLYDMIKWAAKADLKSFEFLGVSEPWIDKWTSQKRSCVSVRIYPFSLQGTLALIADAASLVAHARKTGAKKCQPIIYKCVSPIRKLAGRTYIAGDTLAEAVQVAENLRAQGMSATIGYWTNGSNTASDVADQNLAALKQLASHNGKSYVSVKLPDLQFNKELLDKLADAAVQANCRIHFDAHSIEYVIRKMAACEDLKQRHPNLDIGFTLPGRWQRSVEDADWVCRQRHFVRVVKGQWPDPASMEANATEGFLKVVDRLAGRARTVAIATHDPHLASQALQRLRATETPCEMELLYGMPMLGCLEVARRMDVPVRVYIPYGEAFLPYALSQLRRHPHIIWWLLRDSVTAVRQKV